VRRHKALLTRSIAKGRAFEQPRFLARRKTAGDASLLRQGAQLASII
jgi:hypothetical protein